MHTAVVSEMKAQLKKYSEYFVDINDVIKDIVTDGKPVLQSFNCHINR